MEVKTGLITKRGVIKGKLTRAVTFIEAFDNKTKSVNELKERLDRLEILYSEFDDIQGKIEISNIEDPNSTERGNFEDTFYRTVAKFKDLIIANEVSFNNVAFDEQSVHSGHSNMSNASSAVSANRENAISQLKLPTIEIPSFDGNYSSWLPFYEAFKMLIDDNPNLSNIQRFYYLKSSLKDKAAHILDSLSISTENYATAWDILKSRYENKRILVESHLQALHDLPILTKESAANLRQLLDNVVKNVKALELLKIPVDQWDAMLIFIISKKLDSITLKAWESEKYEAELPTYAEFINFLRDKCKLLESIETKLKGFPDSKPQRSKSFATVAETQGPICPKCTTHHKIYNCSQFLAMDEQSRYNDVRNLRLCANCLCKGHKTNKCSSTTRCKKCDKAHHTLLHFPIVGSTSSRNHTSEKNTETAANIAVPVNSSNQLSLQCQYFGGREIVLLSTASILIADSQGNLHRARALLDSASQCSFITQEFRDKLRLPTQPDYHKISGINSIDLNIAESTTITIHSAINSFRRNIKCQIMPKIVARYPAVTFDTSRLKIPPLLKLADPDFNVAGDIDVLLGASIFFELLCIGQHKLGPNKPTLQKTVFGWVISGITEVNEGSSNSQLSFCCTTSPLEVQLKKLWQLEDFPKVQLLTKEEQFCESHFQSTTERDATGRFVVQLPLKPTYHNLGDSRITAERRLMSMERRFLRDPDFGHKYRMFMQEYIDLGHMTQVDPPKDDICFYLPHHGVINNSSVTTKLRVVFDGSAPSSSGISINDVQCAGPVLQQSLFSILLRFRKHNFVLTADITKMYRQVLISPEQRSLQLILWRDNADDPISTYQLNTVTYGTKAASFLAIRSLCQLADDYTVSHPHAATIIRNDMYVDDLITGSDNFYELLRKKHDVEQILLSAGFPLTKWCSNEPKLLSTTENTSIPVELPVSEEHKALGLKWFPNLDMIVYSIQGDPLTSITKRSILSYVAKIFDPLGLMSPVLITPRIIIQKLWQCKIDWDESIPMEYHTMWTKFQDQVHSLNSIQINRQVIIPDAINFEIHGFCDSSESCYGASIYVRSFDVHGNYHSSLLCAKGKIAPIKTVTIPRLELCAALLLAQQMSQVIESLQINCPTYYWSDSQVVLAWIRSEPAKWKIFVGNRLAEIQRLSAVENWHYVPTSSNPADIITRGIDPKYLPDNTLWWSGPPWLVEDTSLWPSAINLPAANELPEIKNASTTSICATSSVNDTYLFERYSSFTKLINVMALCLRFKHNCLAKTSSSSRRVGVLSVEERKLILHKIIYQIQQKEFSNEIRLLKKDKNLPRKHPFIALSPFLDSDDILRVGGRISLGQFDPDKKHPILLPKGHFFTRIIFEEEHKRFLHCGPQQLLAQIREKFWPLNGRNLARQIVRNCVVCFKVKPKFLEPPMGNLPSSRLTVSRPFSTVGVDFAGPFQMKDRFGRNAKLIKVYLALFICFSSKAIHLELVTDLSTANFLAALRRFMARRGKCHAVYSDNGTNFVGAKHELDDLYKFLQCQDTSNEISQALSNDGISWHFSPPRAPHFGGYWEAGVKSAKYHLKRIIGEDKFTYEEFLTIITQVEAVLNSRPLTPLSSDPSDLAPLTPGHLILGSALTIIPEHSVLNIKLNKLDRFQLQQRRLQEFWARWSVEYISELQGKSKWNKRRQPEELAVGDLVIISEPNLPPLRWKLGRILELHPGRDNIARVATIKTTSNIQRRATRLLCKLPIERHVSSNPAIPFGSESSQGGGHVSA